MISTDALKVQLVEAGVPEVLSEILLRLQGSSQAEDTCIVKAASDLIVSLLLGGKKGNITGQVHKDSTSRSLFSRGVTISVGFLYLTETYPQSLIILAGIFSGMTLHFYSVQPSACA